MSERIVVWFSCGAASAVAAKLCVMKYGDACEVVTCDTLINEHPDNGRFLADVERWIGRPITVLRSPEFATVEEVFAKTRYMAGIAGARCTVELKKRVREAYQREGDAHVFGYTTEERQRADDFEANNPAVHVEWTLIEEGVSKEDCYRHLVDAGIALPAMYDLGFDHNNCLGCVKATSPDYWNRTRRLFPEVFARRAAQSRELGVRLARYRGERVFLDELPADADAGEPDDAIDCGPVCVTPRAVQMGLFRLGLRADRPAASAKGDAA